MAKEKTVIKPANETIRADIDKAGKIVVSPQYESAYSFKDGLGSVGKDGKYGLIDRTGKWVSELPCD